MFNFKAILSKAWVVPLLNMFKAQHVIFKGFKGKSDGISVDHPDSLNDTLYYHE